MRPGPDDRPGGFIVLHRRIRSWPLYAQLRLDQRMIWVELILQANWRESVVYTRAGRLVIQRGQALISQRKFATDIGASHQNVRTVLELLTQEGAIQVTQVPTIHGRKATLVTIVNYEKYQDVPDREVENVRRGQHKPHTSLTPSEQVEPVEPTTSPESQNLKTAFPSDERGEQGVLLCPDAWRARRDAQLEAQYGKGN